jgi:hypothetical protein
MILFVHFTPQNMTDYSEVYNMLIVVAKPRPKNNLSHFCRIEITRNQFNVKNSFSLKMPFICTPYELMESENL